MKKIFSIFLTIVLLTALLVSCGSDGSSNSTTAPCGDTSLVGFWVLDAERSCTLTGINGAEPTVEYVTEELVGPISMALYSNGELVQYYMPSSEINELEKSTRTWYAENGTFVMGSEYSIYKLSGNTLTITGVDYEVKNDYYYDEATDEYHNMDPFIEETKNVAVFVKSNKTFEEWMHDEYLKYADELKK